MAVVEPQAPFGGRRTLSFLCQALAGVRRGSDSNESFGCPSSDGFSSSSNDLSEDDSPTSNIKPKTGMEPKF